MGAVLSWKNWAEQSGASLTVSSEATGLGPRGMLTPQVQNYWRSGNWKQFTDVVIDLDFGVSRAVKVIAFAAPRDGALPPSGATVAIRASVSSQSGTDALNLGAASFTLNPWGVWGWRSATGITARYVRLTFESPVPPLSPENSYLQLGRLWVGDGLVTTYSYAYGYARSFRDPGLSSRAGLTGVRYATRGSPYRVERIAFPILTESEASSIITASSEVGTTGQVFFAREEEYLGEGLFGQFSDVPAVNRELEDLWTTDFQIEEDN